MQQKMPDKFLSVSGSNFDVIIVSGDAYVDHPSYSAAVIGRVLEAAGFKVGIIPQPDWRSTKDFISLGRPRLFFGVTAGNLDSMIANYTANKKPRSSDDYSPGGRALLRPDRATLQYTNRIKEAFPGVPVVIGGIEASMRRLAHYDYWSDKVRRSILLDSKADILVYGMGERQITEIAGRVKSGAGIKDLADINGTVIIQNRPDGIKNYEEIPSFEEAFADKDKFNFAFRTTCLESDPLRGKTIVQRHGGRFIVQLPPAKPLTAPELDRIYGLPYQYSWHPMYDRRGGVPGFETVRFSITSHRGCPGACNFCSLYLHQGRIVQSRSHRSIINEAKQLTARKDFRGTITDIGGPTANLYMASCESWKAKGACGAKRCIYPVKCKNLKLGYADTIRLWDEVLAIPGVKHLFIGSGVRYDLLVESYSDEYLQKLCRGHISGLLKVAPEHSERRVLEAMGKPGFDVYEKFVKRFQELNRRFKKKQYLVNYFISGHPGSRLDEALSLALKLAEKGMSPEQIQDFLPLPMTASGCMYHTGKDPFTGKPVYIARGERERKLQRALMQFKNKDSKRYVIEALRNMGKLSLIKKFYCGNGLEENKLLRGITLTGPTSIGVSTSQAFSSRAAGVRHLSRRG